MENSYRIEKSYKSNGFIVSLIVHAVLLLIFFYLYITPPNPPITYTELGGGGIDLNYGDVDAGTGDPANLDPSTTDPSPETSTTAPLTTEEETPEENKDPEEGIDVTTTTQEDPDQVVVKETEKKPLPKTDNTVKPTENKTKTTTTPKLDSRATLNKPTNKSGDNKNTPGDPGKQEGTVEGKALLGKPGLGGDGTGTGNGPKLGGGLAGMKFVKQPQVNDQTAEKGSLTFKIYANEDGIIINAIVINNLGGISPSLQAKYKEALIGQELYATSGVTITSSAQGTVVWEIKPN